MSATITIAGTAIVPAQPDEVAIGIALSHLATTPDAAISEVALRSQQLEAIFNEMGIGRDRWTTSGVSVNEEREWDGNRQIHRGYRAGTRVHLRVADAQLVGNVMHESVRRCQAAIDGPTWLIAPELTVQSGDLDVTATIIVTFALEQG